MRLVFNPLNEIIFTKQANNCMVGNVEVSNPTSDTIFAYKIKCTDPELFSVQPIKGIIKPSQRMTIQFSTNDPVSLQTAREMVSRHKFLVQFVPVISQLSIPNFKSQQSDRKKYYINMDSIRGSRLLKDQDKMSMHSAVSNKMSYISMKEKPGERNYLTPKKNLDEKMSAYSSVRNNMNDDHLHQKYSRLKDELEDLHRQRQEIVNQMSTTKKSPNVNLKKIIVFIVFLIIGMLVGNKAEKLIETKRLEAEIQRKRKEQSKPWRLFGFLDFLYDEVDPENL